MPTKISDHCETCLCRVRATASLYIYVFIFFVRHRKVIYLYKDFFDIALHIFSGYVDWSRKWKVVQKLFYFDVHLLIRSPCWDFLLRIFFINIILLICWYTVLYTFCGWLWFQKLECYSASRKIRVIRSDCTLDWMWNWRRMLPCNGLQSELHRQGMCRDALYNWRSWHKLNWGQNRRMMNVSSQAGHYYEQTGCNGTSPTNHLALLYK